jgi:hypothetical protein
LAPQGRQARTAIFDIRNGERLTDVDKPIKQLFANLLCFAKGRAIHGIRDYGAIRIDVGGKEVHVGSGQVRGIIGASVQARKEVARKSKNQLLDQVDCVHLRLKQGLFRNRLTN